VEHAVQGNASPIKIHQPHKIRECIDGQQRAHQRIIMNSSCAISHNTWRQAAVVVPVYSMVIMKCTIKKRIKASLTNTGFVLKTNEDVGRHFNYLSMFLRVEVPLVLTNFIDLTEFQSVLARCTTKQVRSLAVFREVGLTQKSRKSTTVHLCKDPMFYFQNLLHTMRGRLKKICIKDEFHHTSQNS
jgi:hypothetical protein